MRMEQKITHNSRRSTKITFTNIDTTVYTIDGENFNVDPAALVNGEYQKATSPVNKYVSLPTIGGECFVGGFDGTQYAINVPALESIDKFQGREEFWNTLNFITGNASDLVGNIPVVGGITVLADAAVTALHYMVNDIRGQIQSKEDTAIALSGFVPYAGTVVGGYQGLKSSSFKPTISNRQSNSSQEPSNEKKP